MHRRRALAREVGGGLWIEVLRVDGAQVAPVGVGSAEQHGQGAGQIRQIIGQQAQGGPAAPPGPPWLRARSVRLLAHCSEDPGESHDACGGVLVGRRRHQTIDLRVELRGGSCERNQSESDGSTRTRAATRSGCSRERRPFP